MSNPVQRQLVWEHHLALMDYYSGLIGAREEGKREGLLEGKREGILEGKREGILEGKREGILEAAKENARRMKADGLDVALIAKYTDLSVAEIEALV